MWINGKMNGKGEMYYPKYDKWITGIWKEGKRVNNNNNNIINEN